MAFTTREIERTYDKRAARYDLTANLYYLLGFREMEYRRRAIKQLDPEQGQTVVELCCGTGLNFRLIGFTYIVSGWAPPRGDRRQS